LDSHAPNKLHEPIDVLVADSYNLDNNEIGIGQDCAATLGVVREIFTVASSLVVGGAYFITPDLSCFL